jgi:hypothetical protein
MLGEWLLGACTLGIFAVTAKAGRADKKIQPDTRIAALTIIADKCFISGLLKRYVSLILSGKCRVCQRDRAVSAVTFINRSPTTLRTATQVGFQEHGVYPEISMGAAVVYVLR